MPVCEICEGAEFSVIATEIREGEGRIVRCDTCGLVMQDLDWDEKRLRDYYERDYQVTNSLVTGGTQTAEEHFRDRLDTIGNLVRQVEPLVTPKSRVIDIGCGAGELLFRLKPMVSRCVGVELNSRFVDFMRGTLGIEAYAGDVNRLEFSEKFDLVLCIATLDHLPNPLKTLKTMKGLLAPGGRIYLEVPNIDEALNLFLPETSRERYNRFFWHRAHLFYFSRETIEALFKKAGLQVDVSCRHEYTLKNFLQWYYLGEPQRAFLAGVTETGFFPGPDEFEKRMNAMFDGMDREFKAIMAGTFRGDNLCILGRA
jgi:SAM-dependent methyltransferase